MAYDRYDLTVIGGGIIGLATAIQIAERHPKVKIILLEKEREPAMHQSGHNSGVIHAGIYYRPGSLKAQTCVSGKKSLLEFCDRHGIPYELCGKVIVATEEEELPRLEELLTRGRANGVEGLELIGPERIKEIEPHATGIKALYSPTTGIIDFKRVAQAYADKFRSVGGEILTSAEVKGITERGGGQIIKTPSGEFFSRYLINCAGLFTDRLARMMAKTSPAKTSTETAIQIIPFRGEYCRLVPERRFLVRGLIYPVPDPKLPFLGVHFTRTIHGDIEVGPNAVLAFAREGYRKSDIDLLDLWDTLSYKGFWLMARNYWKTGFAEMHRAFSKQSLVTGLQRLVPDVKPDDLIPGGAGVRAQAVSSAGALIDDFVISQTANAVHVLNAPSPGATASLAIGKMIADTAAKAFSLEN